MLLPWDLPDFVISNDDAMHAGVLSNRLDVIDAFYADA